MTESEMEPKPIVGRIIPLEGHIVINTSMTGGMHPLEAKHKTLFKIGRRLGLW